MRVLHVVKLYDPWIGGVEQAAKEIAERSCDFAEVEVLTCRSRGWGRKEDRGGVRVTRAMSIGMLVGMPISPTLPALLAAKSRTADIVHFHFPFPLALLAFLLVGSRRPKVVVHHHSDLVRQKGFLTIHRWLMARLLRRADAVVAGSPNMLAESPTLAPARDKGRILPYVLRTLPIPSNGRADEVRRRAGLSPKSKVVLFVGRFAYYKGLQYLIEAMRHVDATLLLVGDGPLKEEVQRWIAEAGISERAVVMGAVSDEELAACYGVADIFVLPSTEPTEAFGLVQLEAMSFGLPVVNTQLPTGVIWVSPDGQTGITVPPKDAPAITAALQRLLSDSDLHSELSRNARARADEFSPERMVKDLKDIYDSVMPG